MIHGENVLTIEVRGKKIVLTPQILAPILHITPGEFECPAFAQSWILEQGFTPEEFLPLIMCLTRIDKYQASSSRGVDPMDTSSAPRSNDEESEEGNEEGDEEEGDEEEAEEEDDDDADNRCLICHFV
ncbi:uncharacterized protein LOC131156100 [Malania oleifera]|uniref:uncharacterized protein LOC131156100 n=1 Tax=Malania oleifera TaxID=397392 RepID=UPI0025AEC287|nr:uncharacterized protein LOC131156100 [Malania oleifera]